MLGGSIFDDFDGDGRPDLLVTSGDWDFGASLFVGRGDGTFADRGTSAGLDARIGVCEMSVAPAGPVTASDIASRAAAPAGLRQRSADKGSTFFMMFLLVRPDAAYCSRACV